MFCAIKKQNKKLLKYSAICIDYPHKVFILFYFKCYIFIVNFINELISLFKCMLLVLMYFIVDGLKEMPLADSFKIHSGTPLL